MKPESTEASKIEKTYTNEEGVVVRETFEKISEKKEKKFLSLTANDLIDSLVKILGLAGLLFAWLDYTDKQHDKEIAARQQQTESLRDSIQLLKMNQRQDSTLRLKELKFFADQENERRNYEQKNDQFQIEWQHQQLELENKKKEERDNYFAQTQLSLFLDITSCLADLIDDFEHSLDPTNSLKKLDMLTLKAKLIKNDSLDTKLEDFKADYFVSVMYKNVIDTCESIIDTTEKFQRELSLMDFSQYKDVFAYSDHYFYLAKPYFSFVDSKLFNIDELIRGVDPSKERISVVSVKVWETLYRANDSLRFEYYEPKYQKKVESYVVNFYSMVKSFRSWCNTCKESNLALLKINANQIQRDMNKANLYLSN
jgi:hypothetical protein